MVLEITILISLGLINNTGADTTSQDYCERWKQIIPSRDG